MGWRLPGRSGHWRPHAPRRSLGRSACPARAHACMAVGGQRGRGRGCSVLAWGWRVCGGRTMGRGCSVPARCACHTRAGAPTRTCASEPLLLLLPFWSATTLSRSLPGRFLPALRKLRRRIGSGSSPRCVGLGAGVHGLPRAVQQQVVVHAGCGCVPTSTWPATRAAPTWKSPRRAACMPRLGGPHAPWVAAAAAQRSMAACLPPSRRHKRGRAGRWALGPRGARAAQAAAGCGRRQPLGPAAGLWVGSAAGCSEHHQGHSGPKVGRSFSSDSFSRHHAARL